MFVINTSVEHTGTVVISVRGNVERDSTHRLADALLHALQTHRPPTLCIDLGLVTYVDPAAIGTVATAAQRAPATDTRLMIRNATPHIEHLLRLAGLANLCV
jgi:anti-anti-sigma factor